jgi:hypothetical protein
MSFNPLSEKGIPIERQLRNWSELNVQPYDKHQVDPYTRVRAIVMNGIEVESIIFSHQFARHTDSPEIKRILAMSRRIEQQQQRAVNWLTPGDESTLEVTIGYEQAAVDLTAYLARTEPDPYIRQVFEFGLLEDFDHLYRYANLLDLTEGKKAEQITRGLTEIMPGRPTIAEHRHPFDDLRAHYEKHAVHPLTRLHSLTLTAAEQQTMNFYMNIGNRYIEPLARALYQEIAMIEEQHVTQYESLLDPLESWFQQEVFHQYNECYLYHSFMSQETDPRIKALWELHLNMEIEQLRLACEMMRRYEGIEP